MIHQLDKAKDGSGLADQGEQVAMESGKTERAVPAQQSAPPSSHNQVKQVKLLEDEGPLKHKYLI